MTATPQPVGPALPQWTPRPAPPRTPMHGRFCRLEPLRAEVHATDLFAANSLDADGRHWTYLSVGPFDDFDAYRAWMQKAEASEDPLYFAIVDLKSAKPVGVAAYMRIDRPNGVIEVGSINYSPLLQRTPAATEAMYLMMRRAFDELGYRRYEWKCDSLNAPSRAAALRLGFTYEGLFRQAVVYKGRSRDTTWFSIIDSEWPRIKSGFERWLSPANFADGDLQRQSLRHFMETP